MLLPYFITKRNVHVFLRELSGFDGITFVSPHQSHESTPGRPFSDELRQEIIHQVPGEEENDLHIWIASERHGTLYSFLHAQILVTQEAQVDLLCAFKWGYNWQMNFYEGFGELGALFLLLEQRGIMRCHLPLALNMNYAGLAGSGWFEQGQGVYRKKQTELLCLEG